MSLTVEFTGTDPADSPFARFSWTRAATAWADDVGPLVRDALKKDAPVAPDTPDGRTGGRLRDSIRYERETTVGAVSAIYTANTPYAGFVLSGTAPHTITAVAARALRFYEGGGDSPLFRRTVQHPGTKPNDFPERAITPMLLDLRDSFTEAMQASAEAAEEA